MNDYTLILTLIGIMILLILYRAYLIRYELEPTEPPQKPGEPPNKSVTNDELNRVLMLMQISGSITPIERNKIYIKTSPFTKR